MYMYVEPNKYIMGIQTSEVGISGLDLKIELCYFILHYLCTSTNMVFVVFTYDKFNTNLFIFYF